MKGRSQGVFAGTVTAAEKDVSERGIHARSRALEGFNVCHQDLANQVKYSEDYQQACYDARVPTGRFITPSFGEWFSGRVGIEVGLVASRISPRVDFS